MYRRSFISRLMAWGLMGLVAVLLSACSVFSSETYHTFQFYANSDTQNAEVLDYRYGEGGQARHADPEDVKQERARCCQSVSGLMPKGDFLYMKWRDILTGRIYEDTVDLRYRLPWSIDHHTIYPMVYGSQLYVFLIYPPSEKRDVNEPVIGPSIYDYRKVRQIYPDQTKK
jgi:hypothetical protein